MKNNYYIINYIFFDSLKIFHKFDDIIFIVSNEFILTKTN